MSKVALVVDDSMVIRKMVSQTLTKLGFETIEAADGVAGLEASTGKELALVITDLNMPRMDGMDFIRELRRLPAHKFTPVVFLTTEMADGLKDEARAVGATAWIVKPFQPEKIITVVQKIAG
jgi:two-component system chemotaxis response regulator CheY